MINWLSTFQELSTFDPQFKIPPTLAIKFEFDKNSKFIEWKEGISPSQEYEDAWVYTKSPN